MGGTVRSERPLLEDAFGLKRGLSMTHAIRFYKTGGPEVLVWEEIEVGKPGPGEVRMRHTAVGVNFVDIYIRSGV